MVPEVPFEKLSILSFLNAETLQIGVPIMRYEAMFNPETFSMDTTFNYCTEESPGSTSSPAKFRNIEPRSFSLELLVDGTGASGEKREVLADIALFEACVGYYGKIHRPSYLVVSWGLFIYHCVLTSYTVNYKLFRPNGTPLRAVITATFKEFKPKLLESLLNLKSSPDLTHYHRNSDGDQLFMISQDTYDTPQYNVQLAEFNELDTIRKLDRGDNLVMPPLKDSTDDLR